MIITISGASGSGKSFIANYIKEIIPNAIHINIDLIGHEALKDPIIKKQLIKIFNLKQRNEIDRKELGKIVFNNPNKMKILTELTWNYMESYIDNIIKNNPNKIIILDWILIPKTKYFNQNNINILVKANTNLRTTRAIIRDNITKEKFIEREKAKPNYNEEEFDYIIDNNNKTNTRKLVKKIYDKSIISGKF